jgi:hypothetical protein
MWGMNQTGHSHAKCVPLQTEQDNKTIILELCMHLDNVKTRNSVKHYSLMYMAEFRLEKFAPPGEYLQ